MGALEIKLFGPVQISHDNGKTKVNTTRVIQGLLAYLLLYRHRVHSREVLADLFWGERSRQRAHGSLNTALWKLKKLLEPEGIPTGTYLKNAPLSGVGFNQESHYWLDVEVFEEGINRLLIRPFQTVEEKHLADLKHVLQLYNGDLLDGCYEEWALRERERLRTLYLRSLIYLMQYYEFHQSYEQAITYGQQILNLDPLREEIHREMMKLYLENGQRALAVRQFEICRLTLAKELGIVPMEDTQALYTEIIMGNDNGLSSMIYEERISFDQAQRQLSEASKNIDLARKQIEQAFQSIAKYSEHRD